MAFSGRGRYMMPFTTRGVVSNFSTVLRWNRHLTRRFLTLAVVVWFMLVKRQLMYVCEYLSQLTGSSTALSNRSEEMGRPWPLKFHAAAATNAASAAT